MQYFTKSEYMNYMQSEAWGDKRKQRLKMDNNRCQMCGKPITDAILTIHHFTYHTFTEEDVNTELVTVCKACHKNIHILMNRPTGFYPDGNVRHGWSTDLPRGIREGLKERGLA